MNRELLKALPEQQELVFRVLPPCAPIATVEPLNRVSDLGFRTNKLVPKESSEVIVCFFPIDRFLTPGFRNLFLKSPAVFFAPLSMLADKEMNSEAETAIRDFISGSGLTAKDLKEGVGCYIKVVQPDQRQIGTTGSQASTRRRQKMR